MTIPGVLKYHRLSNTFDKTPGIAGAQRHRTEDERDSMVSLQPTKLNEESQILNPSGCRSSCKSRSAYTRRLGH